MAKLTNGAIIEGRSWERPEGLYAETVRGGVVDEFGQLTREAYGAISSRRAEMITIGQGMFRWLGNVGEIGGPAEEMWEQAERGEPGFSCRRWTWRDRALAHPCACGENGEQGQPIAPDMATASKHGTTCPRGIYIRFVASEAARMSGAQFRQLYEAEWADWNDLPVYTFDRDLNVSSAHDFDQRLPLHISCDFNVDPMCWILGHAKGHEVWDFDEVVIPQGATTQTACAEVIRRYPKVHELVIFGDASGNARDTRGRRSDYQIIRDMLEPHCINFRMEVPAANPAVSARVNAINAKLRSASGGVSYFIHPRCATLIKDRSRVSWKPGTREIDKRDKQRTHASDASDYRIARLFPVIGASTIAVGVGPDYALPETSMVNVEF